MIERETIRQELIETQSELCDTITQLGRGHNGSFRVRLEVSIYDSALSIARHVYQSHSGVYLLARRQHG